MVRHSVNTAYFPTKTNNINKYVNKQRNKRKNKGEITVNFRKKVINITTINEQ